MKMFQRSIRFTLSLACLFITAGFLLAPQSARAITSYWILQDANGTWNTDANWNNGVPKNPGDVAIITNNVPLSGARTITIDTAVSLKALKFAMPNTASNGYTVALGSGGSLTMDSGDGSHSVIQQLRGSARCKITAATTLSNDVDIINGVGAATYFDVSNPMSGNYGIHINPDGSSAQPYLTTANTFVGNTTIYAGKLLFGSDCFGNTANGTRVITLVSNGYLRVNYGGAASALANNRQIVSGIGGGGLDGNTHVLVLNGPDQFAGTNAFSLYSQNTAVGGLQLNAANNGFSAPLVVSTVQTLRLGASGSLSNAPVILLTNTTAYLDVLAKPSGYFVPSNQVLAGVGVVSGLVNVATAAATVHPGTYWLPGTPTLPGVLTITGGLAVTNNGTYAWELAQLKDNAFAPGTTTYSSINVASGDVNLAGGSLSVNFLGTVSTKNPNSTDAFWKSNHVWTVISAAAPPSGTLTVANGTYTNGTFTTRVNGNTLELLYGPLTTRKGTVVIAQ